MSEAVTAPAPELDPFAAAFAELTLPGEGAPAAAAPEPAADTVAAAEGQDSIAPLDGQEPAPAADTITSPEPAAAPAAPSDDDILARLGNLLKKEPAPAPAPAAAAPAEQPATDEPAIYTPEEQTFLAEYQKDWPEVSKAEALIRRAEYRAIVGYVFNEVQRALSPVMETVSTLATRTHLTDLTSTVPDYDTVRDKVIAWVEEQPKYLQPAYQHVITAGTTDEVADLIGRWRAATGAPANTPAPAAAPKKVTELPPATMKAAAALAPVGSKHTAPASSGIDPSDFGAAFEAFAGKA